MLQVYDRVLVTRSELTLIFVGGILAFSLLTLAILDSLRSRLLLRVSLRLDRVLSPLILKASTSPLPQKSSTGRLERIREFDAFRLFFTSPAANAVFDAPWTPLFWGACFLIHPLIGTAAIVGAGVLVAIAILNARATAAPMAKAAEIASELYAEQSAEARASEALASLGMRKTLMDRQIARRLNLSRIQSRVSLISGNYASASKFIRLFLQSLALGLGAWLAIEQKISPGALIAASILTARALGPVEQLIAGWRQIAQAHAALGSIGLAVQESREEVRTNLPSPSGALRFENVSVRSSEADRFLLRGASFSVESGEVVGVIGPSGAGKTTVARVASGALAPDGGAVRIDGAKFQEWGLDALGRHIGYLPQDIQLIAGTIAENISRFAERHENALEIDAAIVEAAKAAGAHEMIQRLPSGYDTTIGPGGKGLSLGQGQRIAMARALYGWPALLVFDEPSAHLDAEGEAGFINAVRAAKARGAAVLIVAHRMGALAAADALIVVRDGTIETKAPRDEVIRRLNVAALPSAKTFRSVEQ